MVTRAEGKKKSKRCLRSGVICSVRIRKPPDCYGEWITNSVKQIYRSPLEDVGWQAKKEQGLDNHTETKIANKARTFWTSEIF